MKCHRYPTHHREKGIGSQDGMSIESTFFLYNGIVYVSSVASGKVDDILYPEHSFVRNTSRDAVMSPCSSSMCLFRTNHFVKTPNAVLTIMFKVCPARR